MDLDTISSPPAQSMQTHDDDDRLKVMLGLREKGTCDWIFRHDSYKAWLSSYSPSLLWVYGGPGTGKTMLTAAVIADLRINQDAVIHYFLDARDTNKSTVAGLLSSLVAQMKQINLRLQSHGPGIPQRNCNPIARLLDEFSEIAAGFEELYCCIDAIDEADEWKMALVRGFIDLVGSEASPIKFFLTSRPPIISSPSSEGAFIVQLPNNETIRDTRQIIRSSLVVLHQHGKTTKGDQIASQLEKVAEGSFLWVELALDIVERTGEYNGEFPQSLQEQYYRSLCLLASELRDSQKELLVLVLYWLTASLRPLSVRELQLAIAIEPFKQSLDEMRLLLSPSKAITELGGPLVRIRDDGTVGLVHQSLREYLLSNQAPAIRISSQIAIPISPTEANSLITSICLTYLSFPCFNSTYSSQSPTQHSLLQYAACHWYLHAVQTGKRVSLCRSVAKFLYSQQGFNWLYGLQNVFHKSIGELLIIQSNIKQWMQQFDQTDVPQVDDLILTLYRRKFEGRNSFSDSRERLEFLIKFAGISLATGHMDQAEKLYKEVLGNIAPTIPGDMRLHLKEGVTSTSEIEARWKGRQELEYHLAHDSDIHLGPEYLKILWSKANLAVVYQNQGRWREAENLDTEIMELRRKILGPEHPHTLSSMSNLATVYKNQGRWREAANLETEVMELRRKILGPEHPDMLSSMSNLATVYKNQGRWREAANLETEVMELRRKILGPEHPDTLSSMSNLATVYKDQGRWKEAENLDTEVMELRRKILGPEHPDTLSSMSNLATVYKDQGRWKEAENLDTEVMESRRKILGLEHPDTLSSIANLASIYRDQGRWKEAEELEVRVVEVMKRVLGEEHPDTLTSIANLASIYRDQGRWKEAEELEIRVVEVMKRVLGEEHPDTLTSITNLASIYRDQGRRREAEELEIRVVEVMKRVLGEEHPDTLTSIANLASIYRDQGRWKEAVELLKDVVKVQENLAEDHPSRLASWHELARAYQANGQIDQAVGLLEHVVKVRQKLAEDHPSRLVSQHNLASAFMANGRFHGAVQLLEHVIKVQEKLAVDHPDRLALQRELAGAYQANGQVHEAVQLLFRMNNIESSPTLSVGKEESLIERKGQDNPQRPLGSKG